MTSCQRKIALVAVTIYMTAAPFEPFAGGGLISAILRRQSASDSCGPETNSAHFGAVPARYDTEPERLFCFDVTRRKILHELHEVLSRARSILHRTLGEAFRCSANNHWFNSRRRAGQSPQVRPRPGRDDGCRPAATPRRIGSRRSAPWQPLPATKLPEPTEAGFRVSPADRAGLLHCSRHQPESAGCRLLFVQPCRGACRDRAACHSLGALASMR